MAGKEQYKAQQIIKAARDTGGNKTAAAGLLGCTRRTLDNYCKRYKTVQEAFDDERETMVDWAESGLRNAVIVTKAPWAIKFILKTLGKDRGYTERTEQRAENLNVDLSKLTNEQLERLANGEPIADILKSES